MADPQPISQDRVSKAFDFVKGTLYHGISKLAERELLFALFIAYISFAFIPEVFHYFCVEAQTWGASESLVVYAIIGMAIVLCGVVLCSTLLAGIYIWSRTKIKVKDNTSV